MNMNMNMNKLLRMTLLLLLTNQVQSSQLVYTSKNPSFGGSPLYGNFLISNAQAQNSFKDPESLDEEKSALDEFNERLQRSVLNKLTNTISNNFVDDSGNLIPGTTETEDFIIEIVDLGSGSVSVTTTDRLTGDSTHFVIEASF